MTLQEIKDAVEAGKTVHWGNGGYIVIKDSLGQWFVKCKANGHLWGLTHQDGVTLNGKPKEFFVVTDAKPKPHDATQAIMDGLERFAQEDGVQRGIFCDTSGNIRSERVSATATHSWIWKTKAGKPFHWNENNRS